MRWLAAAPEPQPEPDADRDATPDAVGRFFPYAYEERLQLLWRPFGLRTERDGVHVDDERFVATFGRLRLATTRENVAGAHVTRDYRWWTAVGARLSLVDDGLTFGTTSVAGVCVHFHDRVGPVVGVRRHSALTVTVQDVEGLVEVLGGDG
jgi:hypothetical protein